MRKYIYLVLCALGMLSLALPAQAAVYVTVSGTVEEIQVTGQGDLFVKLTGMGTSIGSNCTEDDLIHIPSSSAEYENVKASVTSAYLSGKSVTITTWGCSTAIYNTAKTYPWLWWLTF